MTQVSIIMSVYNQEDFLEKAVGSILNQTFKNFEFLIIDDCSQDKSFFLLEKYQKQDSRIKIFRNKKRRGLTKNLNTLIKRSKGELIARMDGDDVCFRRRLEKQVAFLQKNKKVVLLGSWAKVINKQGKIIGEFRKPASSQEIREKILSFNPFIHSSVMFNKKVVQRAGGYNEEFFYSQDYDLFIRLTADYQTANLAEFLMKFRWMPDFEKQKEQHRQALKVRLQAIKKSRYNRREILKLIKPFLLFLIPMSLKEKYWKYRYD